MNFLILALATRRGTRLVMEDKITAPVRDLAHKSPTLSYLISCPWCTSIWVAGTLSALPYLSPTFADLAISTLALSDASTTLSQAVDTYL